MYIYHVFFYCSTVDGHLGCSHVLVIVNSCTMDTGVHLSFWISFLWVYAQEWVCWIIWQLIFINSFLRNTHAVLYVTSPIYIPTRNIEGFPFLHALSSVYYCIFLFVCLVYKVCFLNLRIQVFSLGAFSAINPVAVSLLLIFLFSLSGTLITLM